MVHVGGQHAEHEPFEAHVCRGVLEAPRPGPVWDRDHARHQRRQREAAERDRHAPPEPERQTEHERQEQVEVLLDGQRPAHGPVGRRDEVVLGERQVPPPHLGLEVLPDHRPARRDHRERDQVRRDRPQPAPRPEPTEADRPEGLQLAPVQPAHEPAREHEEQVDAHPSGRQEVVAPGPDVDDARPDHVVCEHQQDGHRAQQVEVGDPCVRRRGGRRPDDRGGKREAGAVAGGLREEGAIARRVARERARLSRRSGEGRHPMGTC